MRIWTLAVALITLYSNIGVIANAHFCSKSMETDISIYIEEGCHHSNLAESCCSSSTDSENSMEDGCCEETVLYFRNDYTALVKNQEVEEVVLEPLYISLPYLTWVCDPAEQESNPSKYIFLEEDLPMNTGDPQILLQTFLC